MIRAGSLRHRVTVQQLPTDGGTDAGGAPLNDFADLFVSVPAAIRPLSGKEIVAAAQVTDGASTEITFRYLPLIDAKTRVVHPATCCGLARDVIYDVLFAQDVDMKHDVLVLLCSSGLTKG